MRIYTRCGIKAPYILDLKMKTEVCGQFHTLSIYPQGKNPWNPFDRRLYEPQSQSHVVPNRKIPIKLNPNYPAHSSHGIQW
jgi:hypothetical protein